LHEATRRAPREPQLWTNLAAQQLALGRHGDAEHSVREAIAADSRHSTAWCTLALILEPQGRLLEALDAASRAVSFAPSEIAAAGVKAQLQEALGQLDPARRTLETAIARNPMAGPLHAQLAQVAERQGDLRAAADAYERALRLQPDNGQALAQLLFLRKRMGDWHDLTALQAQFRERLGRHLPFLTPFSFLSDPSTRVEQRICAENWTAPLVRPSSTSRRRLHVGRLRIGYLSGDFHDHPTAVLVAGVLEAHDRSRFEIVGYSTGPDDGSALRARVAAACHRFEDLRGAPPEFIARRIRDERIDVLVDLKGHTAGAPLDVLAMRPAPIQVHWLGYPGTLGAPFVDYLIGDPVVTPSEDEADYTESLVILPWSYQSNDRSRVALAPPPRPTCGLPVDAVVLCCFNNTYKINPQVFDAWAQILAAVPGAVLWLLARGERDPAIANFHREATARGMAPERVVFATHRPQAEYLGLYRHADLFLDTWPYNAHTTASDALWEACPVLTWRGSTFAGRVAASLLRAVGLPQLVTADRDAYVTTAIELARDRGRLAAMRSYLEGPGRTSPLFNARDFTRALEAAYEGMAGQYRAGRALLDCPEGRQRGAIFGDAERQSTATRAPDRRDRQNKRIPSMACLGLFIVGINTCRNPSLAASRIRSCPRCTGRISPASPTSPNTRVFAGRGRPVSEEWTASRIATSAAGSLMRTPLTALTKTS
jgi:predicted O-linked N-acetylglucosamine transferase (SPINDLY family)